MTDTAWRELAELLVRDDLTSDELQRETNLIEQLLKANDFERFGRVVFRALLFRRVAAMEAKLAVAGARRRRGGMDAGSRET